MDTLSHALWAYAATKRKANFWLTAFFGMFPDLFAFTIPFILMFFSGGLGFGMPELFPHTRLLYNISHSLIICFLFFGIIYLLKKKVYLFMIGWPIHILMDIPTHEKDFYPTEFLFPLSSFTIDGIRWSNPYIFIGNWILLFGVYIFLFRKEIKNYFLKSTKK